MLRYYAPLKNFDFHLKRLLELCREGSIGKVVFIPNAGRDKRPSQFKAAKTRGEIWRTFRPGPVQSSRAQLIPS
jgi:hypothetical protein